MILDGETWMEMIKSRNKTSHTYNDELADEVVNKITSQYHPLFVEFSGKMKQLMDQDIK